MHAESINAVAKGNCGNQKCWTNLATKHDTKNCLSITIVFYFMSKILMIFICFELNSETEVLIHILIRKESQNHIVD